MIWPPKDPSTYKDSQAGPQLIGQSPFTFGSDLNPSLRSRSRNLRPTAAGENNRDASTSSSPSRESFSSNEYPQVPRPLKYEPRRDANTDEEDGIVNGYVRVRRGSEGWEVRPVVDREEIVQRYLSSRGLEDDGQRAEVWPYGRPETTIIRTSGRYNHYVPESAFTDESDDEPLSVKVAGRA